MEQCFVTTSDTDCKSCSSRSAKGRKEVDCESINSRQISNEHGFDNRCSFCSKTSLVDDIHVKLEIWDTGGQEKNRSIVPMYYRDADAFVLVYDMTAPDSLRAVEDGGMESGLSFISSQFLRD
jgi:GTPase SAR1 family protein